MIDDHGYDGNHINGIIDLTDKVIGVRMWGDREGKKFILAGGSHKNTRGSIWFSLKECYCFSKCQKE